ncbi:unnamed protein product [Polarella glacialis]|uniref:Uncharacterized protein n=1 Tax=Polarella glacialis TaxID=89957 RepID=A0A813LF05_POLGL|nr:unnamed protein product [Polarella glacialis]
MEACGEGQTATTSDATTSVAIRETAASTDRAFYTVPPDLPANMRVGHPLLPNHLSALFELPPHYFRGSQAGGGSTTHVASGNLILMTVDSVRRLLLSGNRWPVK